MPKLTAFLACSFAPADSLKLRPLLDFLNSFRKLGFFGETAERAEVESVSAKVRRMIDESDVFIGIITKRRPVYPPGITGAVQLLCSRPPNLWTPPPWVIQESGYAIRAKKDLILLFERGVEMCGLQGDLEYVPFDADRPAEVFAKLTEMVNDLIAKAGGIQVDMTVTAKAPAGEETIAEAIPAEPVEPKPEPQFPPLAQHYFEICAAVKANDPAKAHAAYTAGAKLIESGEGDTDPVYWDCIYHRARFKGGNHDGLESLRALETRCPTDPAPPLYTAECLFEYGEFDVAAERFLRAAALSEGGDAGLQALFRAAESLKQAKRYGEARSLVLEKILTGAAGSAHLDALVLLYELSSLLNEPHVAFAVAEYALRENPGQSRFRFTVGLDYIGSYSDELAAYHFQQIIKAEPENSAALHNLALALSNSGLPIMSASHYKSAIQKGGTRAAANLVYKYLECGMADEGEQLLEEARKVEGHDKRVEECLADIIKQREGEEGKLKAVLENAGAKKEFLSQAGTALLSPAVAPIAGKWQFPFGDLDITVSGDRVEGRGSKQVAGLVSSGFGSLAASMLGGPRTQTTQTIRKYTMLGERRGNLWRFELTVESTGGALSMADLVEGSGTRNGYIAFESGGLFGSVAEVKDNKLKRPYRIQKLQAAGAAV